MTEVITGSAVFGIINKPEHQYTSKIQIKIKKSAIMIIIQTGFVPSKKINR